MRDLLLLEMKAYIARAESGKMDKKLVKLGATIRAHSLDVEKEIKEAITEGQA